MPHNERFPEMWKIISKHIDFDNAVVVDAGCGYGDFAMAAVRAGAKKVYAIDNDAQLTKALAAKGNDGLLIVQDDINDWNDDWYPLKNWERIHILSCFSVLPYLEKPDEKLKLFSKIADLTLIECQYFEDGPGFEFLMNDLDMELWLKAYWSKVEAIGQTRIIDRAKNRTIWMCQ